MCYEVILSIDSDIDLALFNEDGLAFSKDIPESGFLTYLDHPYRWYVGSYSGCSCGFRHLTNPELGFGPPESWCPEEPEDIHGTLAFLRVLRHLLEIGHQVDCVSYWYNADASSCRQLDVDLNALQDEAFRFFENYHFSFARRLPSAMPG